MLRPYNSRSIDTLARSFSRVRRAGPRAILPINRTRSLTNQPTLLAGFGGARKSGARIRAMGGLRIVKLRMMIASITSSTNSPYVLFATVCNHGCMS